MCRYDWCVCGVVRSVPCRVWLCRATPFCCVPNPPGIDAAQQYSPRHFQFFFELRSILSIPASTSRGTSSITPVERLTSGCRTRRRLHARFERPVCLRPALVSTTVMLTANCVEFAVGSALSAACLSAVSTIQSQRERTPGAYALAWPRCFGMLLAVRICHLHAYIAIHRFVLRGGPLAVVQAHAQV